MRILGGIEGGGTKWVLGAGTSHIDLETVSIPATDPEDTLQRTAEFFRKRGMAALGIGCFGPLDLRPSSPTYGYITSTPKPGWSNTNVLGELRRRLQVPVALDTDVNAAALGEQRWGAAQGLTDFVYLTVGTGIGGGAVVGGRLLHGLSHPEMGHLSVAAALHDSFQGCCPFHGDCLEGMASGPAIRARWGIAAEDLPDQHQAWPLEAHYLSGALANIVCTLSPQRIILGGGVMRRQQLFPLIRKDLMDRLNSYVPMPEIVPPGLGERSGVAGAIVLAEQFLE